MKIFLYILMHYYTIIKWILKWLAFSFDPGDNFSCENHEFPGDE